jgi:hypothetical protein
MRLKRLGMLSLFGCGVVAAQAPLTTLRVSSEVTPAGDMAQIKLLMTSPMPIIGGNGAFDLSQVSFAAIDGINLFSPTGDVAGAAVVNGSQVNVRFLSPGGTFGTNTDYPIMTVALRTSPNCFLGQIMPVNMNPFASQWANSSGPVGFEYKPGSITIGGSVSITDVIPGGGVIPPGGTFSIIGTGFSPKTSISVRGISTSSIVYVSPTEFQATSRNGGRLDGALIQVKNPDNSQVNYYSYMRSIQVGASTRPLLASTVPILPMNPDFEAVIQDNWSALNSSNFLAVALENSSWGTAYITINAVSPSGTIIGTTQLTLDPRYRIQREVSELFGAPLPLGGELYITSDEPVQMMGLMGNDVNGTMFPLWPTVLSAPAPIAPGR